MAESKHCLITAAIDFGTTYSGCAFSFLHDYARDPSAVQVINWITLSGGLMSQKTSTCVLFEPNGRFHSFGFDAENTYGDLALDNKHHDWFYFRHFKMQLYGDKTLDRNFKLKDENKKTMTAMKVFAAAIRYLKDQMFQTCKNQVTDIHESDIRWVLTVPSIWSDSSKQFMRESAEQAGISKDQMMIALEPEAAFTYCKHIPVTKATEGFSTFRKGSKYLVLDAGDEIIDISVLEVQSDGSLKEICKANGGYWGGTKIDDAFKYFLSDIVGRGAYDKFCHDHQEDMVQMYRDFEIKMRVIKPEGNHKVNFKIPMTLNDCCQSENSGNDISTMVSSETKLKGKVFVCGDKLRCNHEVARNLFNDATKQIVDHVRRLMKNQSAGGVNTIVMVGGFSNFLILQSIIQKTFKQMRIILPPEAGLAVLKGAVIYGHESRTTKSRISKYTYGVRMFRPFDPAIHPETCKKETSTGLCCKICFDKHVTVGDTVEVGQPQASRSYSVVEPDQTSISFSVFATTATDPQFVTDGGCKLVGKLEIDMPDTSRGLDRSVTVQMTFGGTELEVEAVDEFTGQRVTASFDNNTNERK